MSILSTARLRLVPVRAEDVDVLHGIWTDASVRRYLWDDTTIDRETAAEVVQSSVELWQERGYGLWVVHTGDSDAPVGFAGFRDSPRDGGPELLFGFIPAVWHQGYATEAARAALQYLFDRTDAAVAWAETDVPNTASARVLERAGMTYVGTETVEGRPTAVYRIARTPSQTSAR